MNQRHVVEILNIDIDHNKLKREFFNLNIDHLLKTSVNKQISVQCSKNSKEDQQLYESCGSLWIDRSDVYNPKPKKNNFIEVNFLTNYNKETNTIIASHDLEDKEPIVFGKSYQGQRKILGLDFEKTYYVKVISNNEFQLTLNKELTLPTSLVFDRNDDLIFRIFKNVSEYRFDTVGKYFKSTYIEEVINKIQSQYPIYRTRFMLSYPKTNLSWHRDLSPRIHIPIYTNSNCFMVLEDTVVRLPEGNVYLVDTTRNHTAVNASDSTRVHLVACL
jgi:hypothetical protein